MHTEARLDATRLADLLRREQQAMADFLLALAGFDRRRGWAALGYASLWYFLHRELGLSKGAASHRRAAADLLQRFPAVEAPLRDGRLCLSSVIELAQVLTEANQAEVLPRFFHLSAREAKEVVAELQPRAQVPARDVVTALPALPRGQVVDPGAPGVQTSELPGCSAGDRPAAPPTRGASTTLTGLSTATMPLAEPSTATLPLTAATTAAEPLPVASTAGELTRCSSREAPPTPPPTRAAATPCTRDDPARQAYPSPPPPRDEIEPLDADLRRLHVTVPRRLLEKLEAARDARSHARPNASTAALLEEALDLLLSREARRRGLTARRRRRAPEAPARPADPDHVPAEIRAAVWTRDEGRCQWPLHVGGICGATCRVEVDHVHPKARGGPPSLANLRLLCKPHNLEAARQAFGEAWMGRYRRRRDAR